MTTATTLRLPDKFKAEATACADAMGVSLNALCAYALREYLDARKPRPAALPAKVVPQAEAEPVRAAVSLPVAQGGKPMRPITRVGANQPCPCGSGLKFKKCHGRPGA